MADHLVQLGVRVPASVYDRIDAARGDVPRAKWVLRAIEAALGVGPALLEPTEDGPSLDADANGSERQSRVLPKTPLTPEELYAKQRRQERIRQAQR